MVEQSPELEDRLEEVARHRRLLPADLQRVWNAVPDDATIELSLSKGAWNALHTALERSLMATFASGKLAVAVRDKDQSAMEAAAVEMAQYAFDAEAGYNRLMIEVMKAAPADGTAP